MDTFREVPQHPVPMHLRQNYFPELFEDDQFHQHRKNLLRRLFTDTRAKPLDTEDYLRKFGDDDDDSVKQGGEGGEAGQEEDENIRQLRKKGVLPPFLPPPALCRYKVAFRDLSKGKDTPTVVRTRTGKCVTFIRYSLPSSLIVIHWQVPLGHSFGRIQSQLGSAPVAGRYGVEQAQSG